MSVFLYPVSCISALENFLKSLGKFGKIGKHLKKKFKHLTYRNLQLGGYTSQRSKLYDPPK